MTEEARERRKILDHERYMRNREERKKRQQTYYRENREKYLRYRKMRVKNEIKKLYAILHKEETEEKRQVPTLV